MSFFLRLLLVPLAGMFILVARRAEQAYQKPRSSPAVLRGANSDIAQPGRPLPLLATAPELVPAVAQPTNPQLVSYPVGPQASTRLQYQPASWYQVPATY